MVQNIRNLPDARRGDTYTGPTWTLYNIVSSQTSGAIVSGQTYIILDYATGDNFVNVGGTNVKGAKWVATGTTPTTYTNGSTLIKVTPRTLAGATIKAEFYSGSNKVLTLTESDGFEVLSASGGQFRIARRVVTQNAGCLDFDVQVSFADGTIETVTEGKWHIVNDKTK
jgi:hypothetical protein